MWLDMCLQRVRLSVGGSGNGGVQLGIQIFACNMQLLRNNRMKLKIISWAGVRLLHHLRHFSVR